MYKTNSTNLLAGFNFCTSLKVKVAVFENFSHVSQYVLVFTELVLHLEVNKTVYEKLSDHIFN